jgi:hypothetical protein
MPHPGMRGFFLLCGLFGGTNWFATQTELRFSGFAAAAIFAGKAEWPADHIEESALIFFSLGSPIFLGRRE